jgi:hypothetical protein
MNEMGVGEAKGGVFDDLIEIFVAPSRVFERRRDGRYGTLLVVLMVLTLVIMVATMGVSAPFWDAQFDLSIRQAAERGQAMPPEATGDAARSIGRWVGTVGQAIAVPIFVWVGALFVMLGAKVAGTSLSFRQGATIFTLAGVPRLISPIATAVQGLLLPSSQITSIYSASLGPARFFDPSSTPTAIMGVLANFDIVTLWAFALVGIGISVMGRVSRGNGYVGMAVAFAGILALSLIPAAFS